jgi:hypothetical protein
MPYLVSSHESLGRQDTRSISFAEREYIFQKTLKEAGLLLPAWHYTLGCIMSIRSGAHFTNFSAPTHLPRRNLAGSNQWCPRSLVLPTLAGLL